MNRTSVDMVHAADDLGATIFALQGVYRALRSGRVSCFQRRLREWYDVLDASMVHVNDWMDMAQGVPRDEQS